jgi:hypothetical protein
MTTVGVITRGKYGHRLIETIISKTDMEVISASVPEQLPVFIDEPDEFLDNLNIDDTVFTCNILLNYALHPDLSVAIAHKAGKMGVRAMIIPGGAAKAPVLELKQIGEKYGMHVEVEEICCTLPQKPEIAEFCSKLSSPILNIETKDGVVSSVKVVRGAPCGSTWHMAENLVGTKIEDAPARAGLLVQQYPCRAVRGTPSGIHDSGEVHKIAVEKALKSSQLKRD